MKKFILLVAFVFVSNANAADVSVVKSKCTLFGNIKIKVTGLENRGRIGTKYLKANVPMRSNCNETLAELNQSMGRGLQAVTTAMETRQFETRTGGGRDNDATCSIIERKTLSMVLNNYDSLVFKRSQDRTISSRTCY